MNPLRGQSSAPVKKKYETYCSRYKKAQVLRYAK
jgi:hypothetical protein